MNSAIARRKKSNIKYPERETILFNNLSEKEKNRILFHKKLFLSTDHKAIHFEKWVKLDFTDGYSISSYCRFKNKSGKIIKPHLHHSYYYDVCMTCNGIKKYFIRSKILATYFILNPENKPEANHKNGIRTDNRIINMEWTTESENIIHSFDILKRAGKVSIIQMDMNGNEIKEWDSVSEAARSIGKESGNIVSTCKGRFNYAYGYKWKYKTA